MTPHHFRLQKFASCWTCKHCRMLTAKSGTVFYCESFAVLLSDYDEDSPICDMFEEKE